MSSLTIVRPTYQTIESVPIRIVEMCGVRKRGWTLPRLSGIALARAIESVVRAVGRIVVWVDAAAEVSTAMIRSLSSGEPKTSVPSVAEHVFLVLDQVVDAVVGLGGDGDDDVDRRAGSGC